METRPFGSTGEEFPILSFGCQRIVDDHDCTEEEAEQRLRATINVASTAADVTAFEPMEAAVLAACSARTSATTISSTTTIVPDAEVVPWASEDSGLYWFFDPDNVELVAKVLDGCWLRAAALASEKRRFDYERVSLSLTAAILQDRNMVGGRERERAREYRRIDYACTNLSPRPALRPQPADLRAEHLLGEG